jgi:NADH:ubiquinone oxidoreductase subunit F (NADH-binding)
VAGVSANPAPGPGPRLLSGPALAAGPEPYDAHRARLGPVPAGAGARSVIPVLEASGLLGRGGAAFPVGRKWRAVADRSRGRAVVLVNGAEGEPLSAKDRTLLTLRPHLVLDGALLAAAAVGADEVELYVGEEHPAARAEIARALASHPAPASVDVRLVTAPRGYVSGEETAAVSFVNRGIALPTAVPPRPFEAGIRGRPTLVQNVESLAYAALIARFGPDWYRSVGRASTRGTSLITVSGAVRAPIVTEIEIGTRLGDAVSSVGGTTSGVTAVLMGGYFGGWIPAREAWPLPLDPVAMRAAGHAFGCGVVSLLPEGRCGVVASAQVMTYLASQSARQCGPCVMGLSAIAEAVSRLAACRPAQGDLERVARWTGQLVGRGACHHPDGAASFLQSALRTFAAEFTLHQGSHRCSIVEGGARVA